MYDSDGKQGWRLEIAEWRGGTEVLEQALFDEADCVTVTGNDETLVELRAKLAIKARLLNYGHRVSFGFVANGVLSGFNAKKVVQRVATDVVAWDQLGCL